MTPTISTGQAFVGSAVSAVIARLAQRPAGLCRFGVHDWRVIDDPEWGRCEICAQCERTHSLRPRLN